MFGLNPIRGVVKGSGDTLLVQEIFLTIQGEGPLVGHPAVFVRLGGCNLACTFCDTEFEGFTPISINQIFSTILNLTKNAKTKLIVITGGEPMRQPIEKFCQMLLVNSFNIQIETNGTIFRDLPDKVQIVCSPKPSNGYYYRIREDLLKKLIAIKFIVSKNNALYSDIAEVGQEDYKIPVYIQPMDEYEEKLNRQNINHAISLSQRFGYILSMQVHKLIDIP